MNKYVSFVSDEIFLEEVKKVVEAYATDEDLSKAPWDVLSNSRETIDQFKTLFDIYSNRFNLSDWINFEYLDNMIKLQVIVLVISTKTF